VEREKQRQVRTDIDVVVLAVDVQGKSSAHVALSRSHVAALLTAGFAVFAAVAPSPQRSGDKSASERGAPAAPSLPVKRNRVALALQRKGQELATWCVLAWRRTRFFGMSPRGEIAFPMLLNKGNVPCTVKCQSGRDRARECSSELRNMSAYESLFNAVLWTCGSFVVSVKFASCLNRRSGTPSCGLTHLADRPS
jgi:hypothetical protein